MPRLLCLLATGVLLSACTAGTDGASSPPIAGPSSRAVAVPGAGDALAWGSGPYGLVLLHAAGGSASDWNDQAGAFADDRMTVLAPETTSADALRAAIEWLQTQRSVQRVAVLAIGETAGAVASLGSQDARLIDQAIVISPPPGLDWTAQFPKLFAASSGEAAAAAAREAADQAAGTWNALLLVDGSASGARIFRSAAASELMTGILRRLDERR